MPRCDHEEADTQIVVHVRDSLERGDNHIMIRTVDSDVTIIPIGQFHSLPEQNPNADIWVGYGTGKQLRYYHINTICELLVKASLCPFLEFMHLQDAIRHLLSLVEVRNGRGQPGCHSQRQLRPSSTLLHILLVSQLMLHPHMFLPWRDSLRYCITKRAHSCQSMKITGTSSVKRAKH